MIHHIHFSRFFLFFFFILEAQDVRCESSAAFLMNILLWLFSCDFEMITFTLFPWETRIVHVHVYIFSRTTISLKRCPVLEIIYFFKNTQENILLPFSKRYMWVVWECMTIYLGLNWGYYCMQRQRKKIHNAAILACRFRVSISLGYLVLTLMGSHAASARPVDCCAAVWSHDGTLEYLIQPPVEPSAKFSCTDFESRHS